MSKQPEPLQLENRQAILGEINALLEAACSIDETRAKKVRKAIDTLRNSDDALATGEKEDNATDNELEAQIDAGLETLRARIHKQVERRNRDYEKALRLMDELETTLSDKELQKAERANNRLLSIMGNIPGLSEQRWQDIEKRLQRVRPQLRKLESWRHWGTTQARQNLISEVTQLTDAGLPPEQLAKRIQQARDQWHDWDKSGDHAGKALWKTFDRACETAYKPCIAHFEKLKQRRAENLKKRQAIIDSLNARYAATDWKQPDWRDIDKFLSHARRDYYKIGNVDHKHRKPLARALQEALDQYEPHLSSERSRSLRVREKLIADIEALAAVDNLRDALEQLEALKKQWKITVVEKRTLENRLWKQFQAACELTYQRRDAERNEQAAERNENEKQKQALIEELTRATTASDAELLANASVLARTRARWQEIGWVPRKHENSLNSRWQAAQQQFTDALKAAESRSQASELDNLSRRAVLCSQWEQAVLAGNAIDPHAIRAEWDALPALSSAHAEAMEQRFSQALSRPDDTTLSRNLADKQAACLRLEVLLELESPPDCQAERMAYQVERLNASMKMNQGTQDSPEDLLLSVLTIGAVPADAAGGIEQRIKHCIARHMRPS
jgi:exonuclease SbcC